ncbi:endonuclease/exonuclease/phosphatase family protein [Labilibaculum sp.]|uniref:endonuclease/exonuclease/phosphatase family protein n=1 Tax=Labilibaculum sp. TaxID=2060723 RepID=UPI003563A692
MKNFLHKSLVVFSLIFSGSLLFSYLAAHINPSNFWLPAFWGLAYPYILAVNILFVVYWIFRKRWSFLLPLIAIVIGYQSLSNFIQFSSTKDPLEKENTIGVLSYNVRSFDHYQWTKDVNTPKHIVQLAKNSKSEIICFQEFRTTSSGLLSTYNLKKELNTKYSFRSKHENGNAIFSRYPITHHGEIEFDKGNLCSAIFTDIQIGKKMLRVYNLHLESNRFVGKNYQFINKKKFKGDEQELDEIKDISFRLRYAFIRRAKQAQIIRAHIDKSPYPTIVCGDFNDTPQSFTYAYLLDDFKDCFKEQGIGISTTYVGDFPSFRIDYILHDEKIECLKYNRIKKRHSDHYPIYSVLSFTE